MPNFDNALKELFQTVGTSLVERLGGAPVREWVNVELAQTRAQRVDLVSWLNNGQLFHLEFQSRNDSTMAERMLDYYWGLFQRYQMRPRQLLLYLGSEPFRMPTSVEHERLRFSYDRLDIRDLNSEDLLNSSSIGDNILAILSQSPEPQLRIRRVLERLKPLEPNQQARALRLLLILSGLRDLSGRVAWEINMLEDVIEDAMKDPFLRRLREKYVEEARAEGRAQGRAQGRAEGEASLVRRLLEQRFGTLPDWSQQKLASATESDLKRWVGNILSASNLEDILQ